MGIVMTAYPDGRIAFQDGGLTLVMTREALESGWLTYAGRTFALDVTIPPVDPQDPLNGWKRRTAEEASAVWRTQVFGALAVPDSPRRPHRRKAG